MLLWRWYNVHYTFSVKAMKNIMWQSCLHLRNPAVVLEKEDSSQYFSFPLPPRIQPRTRTHQPINLLLIVPILGLSHTQTALDLYLKLKNIVFDKWKMILKYKYVKHIYVIWNENFMQYIDRKTQKIILNVTKSGG